MCIILIDEVSTVITVTPSSQFVYFGHILCGRACCVNIVHMYEAHPGLFRFD